MKSFIKSSLFFVIADVFLISTALAVSLALRFEFNWDIIPSDYKQNLLIVLPINIIISLIVFDAFRLYNSIWRFAGVTEAVLIFSAVLISASLSACVGVVANVSLPYSCYVNNALLLMLFVAGSRFIYRFIRHFYGRTTGKSLSNIMIIGAGAAGSMLIKEFSQSRDFACEKVVCVIDDDKTKHGKFVNNVKIVGGRESIQTAVKKFKVNEIIYAIPSDLEVRAEVLKICRETGCELKTLPSINQSLTQKLGVEHVRKVQLEDLLGREQVNIDSSSVNEYINGKTVLVTGGGGSIGSELCRQIAGFSPSMLIILDIYENNAYDIQNELKRKFSNVNVVTLIGSIRDSERMDSIFEEYHPDVVYHAAAHKHVPLMEDSPNESVKNNVFGTLNVVRAAHKFGVKRFVMISTDKAVNPTNIMGATKRICEMIVQQYNEISKTDFVAVRFGNVIGSNGSVIPLFKKQIAEGGPVTVTDPKITRFFMTITEAVSLVLQAGVYAKGGEIFVLDMGSPVKILDVAENLIRLSGFTPYVDMQIKFTGLRPGEKLYEELLMEEEGLQKTENSLIHIGKPIEFNERVFWNQIEHLKNNMLNDEFDIRTAVMDIVPTYNPISHSAKKNDAVQKLYVVS
ncbi:MAG: polysaccharide biosynthesis protein [Clostridiales bacterium]|jgi:FlaA1/EpsC-like NDP-sugar epimerase|nr:polysaccharide biosynthesis protein [Clostridiales bacterium]